ncbi:creatininase family protein [Thermoactinomyces mirandus]|uniref:Creatininase family protein n=1 Tax=Thermoactinomyces mirandus TaxID=2756294 RepID=A0A7W1XU43_9BACL|nr:creatininase family protein [Thermoactinomyces mirandus]MBA4603281.1 creatininase family protein [Thermoactinomyces mirandus]
MNHFPTWTDLENVELAFFPIGSTEQHGFHLPTNTDSIIATAIAQQLAQKHRAFVVPTLPYSSSFEHMGFPGCLSLRMRTILSIIEDILYSLEQSGITRCVIINGHGGNRLLSNIAQEINQKEIKLLVAPSRKHWEKAYELAGLSTTPHKDMHAGEGETSILLHLFHEQAVRMDQIIDVQVSNRPLLEVLGMRAYTQTGTIGFPSRASRKKGKALLNELVAQIDKTVVEFLGT